MAGKDQGANLPRRRFVTRIDVQDAAARGESLSVGSRDVVTDEAAQRAADLGVRIERGVRGAGTADPPGPGSGELRRAVRAAVVAELGQAPAALDQVIDRVLKGRGLG